MAKFTAHSAIGGGPPGRPWPYPLISAYTNADKPVKSAAIVVHKAAYEIHRMKIAAGDRVARVAPDVSRTGNVIVDEGRVAG
ncbi:MAG: hypothetical protein ACREPM_07490 [Gemmatimonadaceae bacterium]